MAENSIAQDFQEGLDLQVHREDDSAATDCRSNTDADSPSRNWQIDQKTLTDCMLEVYKNKLWTDMIIHCGTSQEKPLKAHKIILAARSPVFEAMLFGPCSEQKIEYTFPDADEKTFDNLLRYLYNDDIKFSDNEEAIELMQTAHMYQITSLEDFCDKYLQAHITQEDACKILDIAIKFDKMDLKESCCHFIDRNADDVLESDEFLNISPECLEYILKGDTLWAKEDAIFYRVEEWAKRRLTKMEEEVNGQNMRNVIGDAMYHIRLPTLQMKGINECIRRKGYFTFTEFEDILDCHLGNQSRLSFMSNNPRMIPDQNIMLTWDEDGDKKFTKGRQTLLIGVRRTVYLKSLSIAHFNVFLKYNSVMHSNYATAIVGQLIPKPLNGCIRVVITVDQVDFRESFRLNQAANESEVTLTKPLLLKKQQTPYTLELQIFRIDSCSSIKLVGKKGTVKESFTFWGKEKYISISQPEKSMLGIKQIGFTNSSRRENDITIDWSDFNDDLEINNENTENSETWDEEFD